MRIEVDNVSFSYGPSTGMVIKDICMDIDRPGLYCIIGPNGVGKSTLIKCLNKINKPTSGTVKIDGRDIEGIPNKDVAKMVSYVPVAGEDMFSMPVVDAVLIGRFTHQKWKTTVDDLKKVYRTLKLLGISSLSMRGFNELSAGQHQKVAIARALVQETPIMLLDEPTANLDVRYQVYIAELLKELAIAKDMIIIMISHDLNIASRFSDKVIMMEEPGVIRQIGAPEDVINKETIEEVYGVSCEIFFDGRGKPQVMLGSALRIDE